MAENFRSMRGLERTASTSRVLKGTAFRDFLLSSPEMLVALGEGTGVINHITSFWRFRFPKNRPLEANAGELLDILQDFESGLGGDIPAIAA